MSPKNRGVIIGTSGLFAGALAGRVSPWPTLPKAALVVTVAVSVSLLAWAFLRPKGT